jgi:hypothetical protein
MRFIGVVVAAACLLLLTCALVRRPSTAEHMTAQYSTAAYEPTSFYEYEIEPRMVGQVDVVAGRKVDTSQFACGPDEVWAYTERSNAQVISEVRTLDEYAVFVVCDAQWVKGNFELVIEYDNAVLGRKFANTTHGGSGVRSRFLDDNKVSIVGQDATTSKTGPVVLAKIHFAVIFNSDTRRQLFPITNMEFKLVAVDTHLLCDVIYDPYKSPLYVYPKDQSRDGRSCWYMYGPLRKLKKNDIFHVAISVHTNYDLMVGGIVRTMFDPEVLQLLEVVWESAEIDRPFLSPLHHACAEEKQIQRGDFYCKFNRSNQPELAGLMNQFRICKVKFKLVSADINKIHEDVFSLRICELYSAKSPLMTVTSQNHRYYGVLDGTGGPLSILQVKEQNHALISTTDNAASIDVVDGKLMYTTISGLGNAIVTSEPEELGPDTTIQTDTPSAGATTPPPPATTTTPPPSGTTTPPPPATTTSGTTTPGTTTPPPPATTTPGTTTPPPSTTTSGTTTPPPPATTASGTTTPPPPASTSGTTTPPPPPGTTAPPPDPFRSAPTYFVSSIHRGDGDFIGGAALIGSGVAFLLFSRSALPIAAAAAAFVWGGSMLMRAFE